MLQHPNPALYQGSTHSTNSKKYSKPVQAMVVGGVQSGTSVSEIESVRRMKGKTFCLMAAGAK
jgi:hypothetical protein